MTDQTAMADIRPWYRQAWPWFLISLPASAVIGGIITIIIAVNGADPLVVDDYYKEGLAINEQKHRQAAAADMGLNGLLRSNGEQVTLALSHTSPIDDDQLVLRIVHSTRPELDRELALLRTGDGQYAAAMQALPAGTWYLRLEDSAQTWEIRARMVTDGPFQAYLKPQSQGTSS